MDGSNAAIGHRFKAGRGVDREQGSGVFTKNPWRVRYRKGRGPVAHDDLLNVVSISTHGARVIPERVQANTHVSPQTCSDRTAPISKPNAAQRSGIQSSNRYPTVGDDCILRPEKIPQSSVDIPEDSFTSEEELLPKTSNAQASIRIDASESVKIIMCLPGECVINIDTEAMISTT